MPKAALLVTQTHLPTTLTPIPYTAKATYSNLAAYYVDKQMGVGAVLDSDMRLSAVPFLPHSSPFADSLYVQKFSRSCGTTFSHKQTSTSERTTTTLLSAHTMILLNKQLRSRARMPLFTHCDQFFTSLILDDPSFCFRVPVSFPGVPLSANMSFVERAYLQPSTHVGPDGHSLQHPIVLHFLPSKK